MFYNPPVVNRFLGIRRSYINEDFARRAGVPEARLADHRLRQQPPAHGSPAHLSAPGAIPQPPGSRRRSAAIAAGICPASGAKSSAGLRDGRIRGVVSTNALELGHRHRLARRRGDGRLSRHHRRPPGSAPAAPDGARAVRAPCWSPSLRAARSVHRPAPGLFSRPLAGARLHPARQSRNPDQPPEMRGVRVAASQPDERFGEVDLPELCARLAEAGFLHRSGDHWHWTQEAYPADTISLRSVTSDNFVIMDITARAGSHRRSGFLQRAGHRASARPFISTKDSNITSSGWISPSARRTSRKWTWTTTPTRSATRRCASSTLPTKVIPGASGAHARSHGDVLVRSQVVGFKKIKFFTQRKRRRGPARIAGKRDAHHGVLDHAGRAHWSNPSRSRSASGKTACSACSTRWNRWPRCC